MGPFIKANAGFEVGEKLLSLSHLVLGVDIFSSPLPLLKTTLGKKSMLERAFDSNAKCRGLNSRG